MNIQGELLGEGHFGKVWKEYDTYTGRVYATKYIPLGRSNSFENLDEAKLMAASGSRHIVQVYSASKSGDHFVICTEFMTNGSLEKECAGNVVSIKVFYVWFPNICRGVADLHAIGILHRDIKPANVLLDANRNVKLGDFGLALMEGTSPDYDFMAYLPTLTPESHFVDSRAGDVYALGCLAYRILNGESEWQRQLDIAKIGEDPRSALRIAIRDGAFPDRNIWSPHVHERLKKVIVKALNVDPLKRHSSASELCEAIEKTIPKIYWRYDPGQNSWLGESKKPRDKRVWKLGVANGQIEAKHSVNGASFRRMGNVCGPTGKSDRESLTVAIRKIEAGQS